MNQTSNLHTKAMLVGLAIRGWQARKYDRKVSIEVVEKHSASADAGRFNKHLLPGAAASYDYVHKKGRELRSFYYEQTLPWSKDGQRVLPASNYEAFSDGLRKLRHEYDRATETFLRDYPTLKEDARALLGSMFNEMDYPMASEMRWKFGVETEIMQLPTADDFRVALSDNEVARIRQDIERRLRREMEGANRDLWNRLRSAVDNMEVRLSKPDGKFHDTLVGNIEDLVDLIPRLNVMGDENLESIRIKCQQSLTAHSPQELRDNSIARGQVAAQAAEIATMMDAYM
jgi:hypothetical protein